MRKIVILMFLMILMLSTAALAQELASGFARTAAWPDTENNVGGSNVSPTAQITASSFMQPGTLAYLVATLVSLGIYAKRKQRKRS